MTAETVEQRVRAHDQYQIEFKLDYDLLPAAQTRYQITTYLFVPQSLGIRPGAYSTAEFYRDIQNYVRLKTPVFAVDELLCSPASPLRHVEQLLREPRALRTAKAGNRLGDSFKFLRAILNSSLRRHLRHIKRISMTETDLVVRSQQVEVLVTDLIEQTQAIVGQYRSYAPRLEELNVEPALHQAYRLTDESISLVVEESLVDAFRLVHKYLVSAQQTELENKLDQAVQAELAYRRAVGHGALIEATGDNEAFLFRSSVLKKFTSSVLYLSLSVKREGTALEHFLFAIAAGLSMVFATVIAFYFQYRYGQLTLPFFIALVVAYMFKDRIKELGRYFFAKYLSKWLFDRRILIKTLDGAYRLGSMREKVTFVAEEAAPPAIVAQRNRNLITELDNEGQGEYVICYHKEVVLRANPFKQVYPAGPAITGITDIIRLDVRPYLRKMDDPIERWFHLQDGKLQRVQAAKVYYLNFVTAYTVGDRQISEKIERTQVTLTRNGIKRVERFG